MWFRVLKVLMGRVKGSDPLEPFNAIATFRGVIYSYSFTMLVKEFLHMVLRPSLWMRERTCASHRRDYQVIRSLDPVVAGGEYRRDQRSLSPVNPRDHHRLCSRRDCLRGAVVAGGEHGR